MLNKVRVGNIDDDVEKSLKTRFIHEYDEKYKKDAFHKHAENEHAMKRNDTVLNDLAGSFTKYRLMAKFQATVNKNWQQLKLLRIKNKQKQEV